MPRGSSAQNRLPRPICESMVNRPFMASHRLWVNANPSPVPPNCRVIAASAWVKGWKILAWASMAMPMPVSQTSMRTWGCSRPALCRLRRTSTRPWRVNFNALESRLLTICRTRVGSPSTIAGKSGAIRQVSSTLAAAFCDSRLAVSSISTPRSNGMRSSSSWPASNFDRSRMSLSSSTRTLPESWAIDSCWRCSTFSGPSSDSASIPSRPLSGVRISWLMLARNAERAWAMSRAVLRAICSSSLDWLRRVLLALSSRVRASTMSSSSLRWSVRRFSSSRKLAGNAFELLIGDLHHYADFIVLMARRVGQSLLRRAAWVAAAHRTNDLDQRLGQRDVEQRQQNARQRQAAHESIEQGDFGPLQEVAAKGERINLQVQRADGLVGHMVQVQDVVELPAGTEQKIADDPIAALAHGAADAGQHHIIVIDQLCTHHGGRVQQAHGQFLGQFRVDVVGDARCRVMADFQQRQNFTIDGCIFAGIIEGDLKKT